jgi:hypothetical protein
MTSRDKLNGILIVAACLLAAFLLQTHRLGAVGVILAAALGIIIRRGISRGAFGRARLRGTRDYSLRPAAVALFKAVLTFAVAMVWTGSVALAVRYGWLPDKAWTAYGLLGVPLLGLTVLGILFLGEAMSVAQHGTKK